MGLRAAGTALTWQRKRAPSRRLQQPQTPAEGGREMLFCVFGVAFHVFGGCFVVLCCVSCCLRFVVCVVCIVFFAAAAPSTIQLDTLDTGCSMR